jgi:deoxycytidine triphosphate deaminase
LLELAPGQKIDLSDEIVPKYTEVQIPESGYILPSKGFILASSIEKISTSRSISVLVDGISALSRVGLSIHQSSMHCKPGQDFYTVTLEMFNAGNSEIILRPGINIGKFLFIKSKEENSKDYKSKYLQKDGPKGARFD